MYKILTWHFLNNKHPFLGGGEDINGGERFGGRLALTLEPTDNVTITPRVLYQEVTADGFNRQEFFNLYANEFTTVPNQLGEREQFLQLREAFSDETFLADLVVSIGLGGAELTSVTSYIDRDILVSRDASALTGSVSVDLGYPDEAGREKDRKPLDELVRYEQW